MSAWAGKKFKNVLSFTPSKRQQRLKSCDAGTQTTLSGDVIAADSKSVQSRTRQRRRVCTAYEESHTVAFPAKEQQHWLVEVLAATVSEVLQYPWGADALFMCSLVLLAALCVIAYYVISIVIPIMALAVVLAIINWMAFESSIATRVFRIIR